MDAASDHARLKREEVLQVSARLFSQKGYKATTLSDVAAELGFTRAAIYYYFASKQEILGAVLQDASDRLVTHMAELKSSNMSPIEKLERTIATHVEFVTDSPYVLGVYLNERTSLPDEESAQLNAAETSYVHDVAEIIAEGIEAGDFRTSPPVPTALTILGTVNWLQRWYDPSGQLTPAQLIGLVSQLVLHGLGDNGKTGRYRRILTAGDRNWLTDQ